MGDDKHIHINGDNPGILISGDYNSVNFPPHIVPKFLTKHVGLAKDINFIGRKKELQKVDKLLTQENALLLINGIGGIGKSTLASYYFTDKKNNFDYCGFIQTGEDIKSSLTSALGTSLCLKSKEIDALFNEAITNLHNLKGKKLLVFDDIKAIDNQKEEINTLLTLKNSGFKLLFTSREIIENIPDYPLDVMNIDDARNLFLKYYPTDKIGKVDRILEYLDYHTLFVEITAKTLKEKEKSLTLNSIIDKFENGKFTTIKRNRQESFNTYLTQLFMNDRILKDDVVLLFLKKLSILPSIGISFEDLYEFFICKDKEKFEEILTELIKNGWLIKTQNTYKFHQVLKEYILENHAPTFEEIKSVFMYFFKLIENSADMNITILHKDKLIFFDALNNVIKEYKNFEVTIFYMNLGNIYRTLSIYKKALFYSRLSLKRIHILEKIISDLDKENLLIWKASIYNNLSQTYYCLGNYKKTFVLDKKALALREENLGENHIHTIQSYNNLAQLYFSCGDINKAKILFIKSINAIDKVKVDELNLEAIILNEKSTLYSNYASFLIRIEDKNKDEILKYSKKAVDLYTENKDYFNPALITCKFNLAKTYEYCGEYNKAEKLYIDVLESKINVFGEYHNDVATTYIGISLFYSDYKKNCKLCIDYINKAIDIYKMVYSTDLHPSIALAYDNLGSIYNKFGNYKQANTFTLKALKLHEKLLGESHYTTVINYYNVGISYYILEDFKKANEYLLKAIHYDKTPSMKMLFSMLLPFCFLIILHK